MQTNQKQKPALYSVTIRWRKVFEEIGLGCHLAYISLQHVPNPSVHLSAHCSVLFRWVRLISEFMINIYFMMPVLSFSLRWK